MATAAAVEIGSLIEVDPEIRAGRPCLAGTQVRRPLLTEGEIGTLPDNRLLAIKTGVPPILAEKVPYFRHPDLARRARVPAPDGTERS